MDAFVTVTTPVVAVIDAGSRVTFPPPAEHVVIMFEFVSTTRPVGKVSTKPRPVFAGLPGLFVSVNIRVEICPLATVVGKNFFVSVGMTAYTALTTPEVAVVIVLTGDSNDVTAVVVSVVVPEPPVVTVALMTAAVDTSRKLTLYAPGARFVNE
jgi:hypothetical protein